MHYRSFCTIAALMISTSTAACSITSGSESSDPAVKAGGMGGESPTLPSENADSGAQEPAYGVFDESMGGQSSDNERPVEGQPGPTGGADKECPTVEIDGIEYPAPAGPECERTDLQMCLWNIPLFVEPVRGLRSCYVIADRLDCAKDEMGIYCESGDMWTHEANTHCRSTYYPFEDDTAACCKVQ